MVVTGLLVLGFVGIRVATHGGRLGAFAVAGSAFVHGATPDLPVTAHSTGYDGQFYYRLAQDPLTRRVTADGITLDNPSYRQQRIGYPATAWLLARVTGAATSLALVLVNALAVLAVGGLGALWARRLGRSPWWGVGLAASPALLIALARDLTEPLATAALLAGLLAWTSRRRGLAALAFTAAALTRETTLAVVFGLALTAAYWAWRDRHRRDALTGHAAAIGCLAVPAAVEIAWQFHLRGVWGGRLPVQSGHGQLALPFLSPIRTFFSGVSSIGLSHQGVLDGIWFADRILLAALLVVVALGWSRSRLPPDIRVGWVVAALIAVSVVWARDVQFVRAANEAIVVGQLVLLGRSDRTATRGLLGVGAWSGLVAALYAVAL